MRLRPFYFSDCLLSTWAAVAASAVTTTIAASGTCAAGFALVFLARFLGSPAFEHSLARESDLALRIDIGHHDRDLIAHIDHIFHFVHALTVELRNMDESI